MRYVAALLYGLAASGSGHLLDRLGVFALVAAGTICVLFAVEGIITEAMSHNRQPGD